MAAKPVPPADMAASVAAAWDAYAQAINARDVAVDNARARVEREFVGIIEVRRQAYLDAVAREKA